MTSRHLRAWKELGALRNTLRKASERDPEQEVQGIALPVLDAVIADAKDIIGQSDPAVAALVDVMSPEVIEAGEPVRAVDALLVVEMLYAALGTPAEVSTRKAQRRQFRSR